MSWWLAAFHALFGYGVRVVYALPFCDAECFTRPVSHLSSGESGGYPNHPAFSLGTRPDCSRAEAGPKPNEHDMRMAYLPVAGGPAPGLSLMS